MLLFHYLFIPLADTLTDPTLIPLQDIDNLDSGKLVQLQVEQIEKEKKDLAQKLSGVSKRLDHLERAFRQEEIPLLKEDYKRQQQRDRAAHEAGQALRVETQRKQHAQDVQIKQRLVSILPDLEAFRTRTETASRAEFDRYAELQYEKLQEAKAARRQEIKEHRIAEAARQEEQRLQAIEDQARAEGECLPADCDLGASTKPAIFSPAQRQADAVARAEEEAYRIESEARLAQQKLQAEADLQQRRAATEAARAADQLAMRERAAKEEAALARSAAGIKTREDPSAPVRVVVGSRAYGAGFAPAASAPAPPASSQRRVFNLTPRSEPLPTPEPVRTAAAAAPTAVPVAAAAPARSWRDAAPAAGSAPARRFDAPTPRSDATPAAGGAAPPPRTIGSGKWSANRTASGGAGEMDSRRMFAPPRLLLPAQFCR